MANRLWDSPKANRFDSHYNSGFDSLGDPSGVTLFVGREYADSVYGLDGNTWASYSTGSGEAMSSRGDCLCSFGDKLYAAVNYYLKSWDGTSWSTEATANGKIRGMCVWGGSLVVCGAFTQIGGAAADGLGLFDGSSWSGFTSAPTGSWNSVYSHNGTLWAAGFDNYVGPAYPPHKGISVWNGTSWTSYGLSPQNATGFTSWGSLLVFCGGFTVVDTQGSYVNAKAVAAFDGSSFYAFGSGVASARYVVEFYDSTIYAGGDWTGISPSVQKWTGSTWAGVSSIRFDVFDMALVGDKLNYAAWDGVWETDGTTEARVGDVLLYTTSICVHPPEE